MLKVTIIREIKIKNATETEKSEESHCQWRLLNGREEFRLGIVVAETAVVNSL